MVITIASYVFKRHLGWRTQSCLGQNSGVVASIIYKTAQYAITKLNNIHNLLNLKQKLCISTFAA